MNVLRTLLWLAFMPPCLLVSQEPDFEMNYLHNLESGRGVGLSSNISASVSLFCDGEYLSLFVEVKDPQIQMKDQNRLTDQIELWMALPQSVYPSDFEFQLHPYYIKSSGPRNIQQQASPRLFSTYSEYKQSVELAPFITDFDYPTPSQIQYESLSVPLPSKLSKDEIHYGIVHYGLFSDGRPPVLYNREYHQGLEEILNISLGDFTKGITYTVDYTDNGYIINAQISCEALGFVPPPKLDHLRFIVDISNARIEGGRVYPCLSTSDKRDLDNIKSFNQVYFSTPLYTNKTNIPDYIFQEARFHPIYVFSQSGWVATSIDTDALVYKERKTSQALTEVKFSQQFIDYKSFQHEGLPLESLKVEFNPVNALKYQREYMLVQGKILMAEWTPMNPELSQPFDNSCFQFADGKYGMIVRENQPYDPFGWGDCGNCVEEKITIYRIEDWNIQEIVNIRQGNGLRPYCQIEGTSYDDYTVSSFDWVKKGRMLVVRLDGRNSENKKRVKLSWNANGKRVKVEEVE